MFIINDAYHENIAMFFMPGLHYDVILGMPWSKRHKPIIEWDSNSVTVRNTGHVTLITHVTCCPCNIDSM